MKTITSIENIHQSGKFGDYQNKNEEKLIKVSEVKNLFICQVAKYKNLKIDITNKNIDGLNLPKELKTCTNSSTRILWTGPDNWLVTSLKKDLLLEINNNFNSNEFAVTDLSHSRAVLEIEGKLSNEVIKKGSPLNINDLKEGNCANTVYNGITITIDFIKDETKTVRFFALRSFGESLYESLTDACLEYGYIAK